MAFQINPTSAPLGAVVTGLDINDLSRSEAIELYQAWLKYGVLVFRDTEIDNAGQVKLSHLFGETVPHPIEAIRHPEEPMLIVLAANDGKPVADDDPTADSLAGVIPWHTDLMYTDTPTRGSLLRAMKLPVEGGNTGWIDTARLYDQLSPKLKCKVQGLRITHSYVLAHSVQNMVKETGPLFPDVSHPLVYVHPESGLPVLNISPSSAKAITGLPAEEAKELLDTLLDFACRDEEAYIHHWQLGDVVLWDNWRTMHRAYGHLKRYPRVMHRTTLKSDMRLGEWLPETQVQVKAA